MGVTIRPQRMYTKRADLVTPNVVQQWILEAFRSEAVSDLFVSGGLGGGKTAVGAQVLAEAIAYNAAVTRGQVIHYAIISSDYSQLTRVTLEAFRGVWNAMTGWTGYDEASFEANPTVLKWDKQHHQIYLACGAIVRYGTGENAAKSIEGDEYSVIWVDEPALCKEETQERVRERFREKVAGTIRGIISTGTPRDGWSLEWLHSTFGSLLDYVPNDIGQCRVALPTRLNLANLPSNYILRLERMYSAAKMKAMLEGIFVLLSGRSVPDYDEDSIMDWEFNPELPVVVGWDPGFHRPYAMMLQEYQPDHWVAFDEVATYDQNTGAFGKTIIEHAQAGGYLGYITKVIHDPAAGSVQSATGTTDIATIRTVLEEEGGITPEFHCSRRPEDTVITVGMERLRAWVRSYSGLRRLKVGRHVTQYHHGMDNQNRPVVGIHKALSEQPLDAAGKPDRSKRWDPWSHPMDVARYMGCHLNPVWTEDHEGFLDAVRDDPGVEDNPLEWQF